MFPVFDFEQLSRLFDFPLLKNLTHPLCIARLLLLFTSAEAHKNYRFTITLLSKNSDRSKITN